jgi:hypothetical protein
LQDAHGGPVRIAEERAQIAGELRRCVEMRRAAEPHGQAVAAGALATAGIDARESQV